MPLPSGVKLVDELWSIDFAARQPEESLAGPGQYAASLWDGWRAELDLIIPESLRMAWNAWIVGRRGPLLTEAVGPKGPYFPATSPFTADGGFSDTTTFSDGTGFGAAIASAITVGSASAGAVSLTVTAAAYAAQLPAQTYLGLSGRLYLVESVTPTGVNTATVTIWPPLRASVSGGTAVSANPRCPMRMVNPDFARLQTRGVNRITLRLEEA